MSQDKLYLGCSYDEIHVEKSSHAEPITLFPMTCPVCKAKRSSVEHRGTPWMRVNYACGGYYESKPQIKNHTDKWWGKCKKQIQNHTDKWWGKCKKGEEAIKTLGLTKDIPTGILRDAMEENGLLN